MYSKYMNIKSILMMVSLSFLLKLGGLGNAVAQTNVENLHLRFIERLVMASEVGELQGKPIDVFMREEKISMLEGNYAILKTLLGDSTVVTDITLVDGKRYAVSFSKEGQRKVVLTYPASYQLILGVTLMEAEDLLFETVLRMPLPEAKPTQVPTELLQKMGTGPLYVLQGVSYMLPELNSNRYYVKPADTTYDLLYSEDFPLETMANLVTAVDIDHALDLDITMVKYGYRLDNVKIPLRRWVAYCLNEGCMPYFGVVSNEKDKIVCELVMQNEMLGYVHLMKLEFNPIIIANRKGVVKARLNSYIPIWNLKTLFAD